MPAAAATEWRPTPPEHAGTGKGFSQCLMCKQAPALPTGELCPPCLREFDGLSEKPCLAVLRFDMAQRAALLAEQRTEEQRLSELKMLLSSRSRFMLRNSDDDELLPISSSALRATARREVGQPANVAAKVRVHRSPRGTVRHKLEGLASSEAKHEAARAAMERRRRIRRGEAVSSEEEEEEEEEEEQPQPRRSVHRGASGQRGDGTATRQVPKHAIAQQKQRKRCQLSFCMGMHQRLGRSSPVFLLPAFLVKRIVSMMDDVLLDLGMLKEHSLLSPMGPSKAARGAVTALAADPGTSRLFTGGADGSIVVWDCGTGEQLQVLRGHSHAIQTMLIMMNQAKDAAPSSGRTSRDSARSEKPRGGEPGSSPSSPEGGHDEAEEATDEDLTHRMSMLQLRFPEQSLASLGRLLRYHRGDTNQATAYVEAHAEGNGVRETPCVAAASSSPAGASSSHVPQQQKQQQPFTPRRGRAAALKHSPKKQLAAGSTSASGRRGGGFLVSGCAQGAVVWSLERGLPIRQHLHHISGTFGPVDEIAALGGGGSLPLLVCGGKRGEVHLWDLDAEPTGCTGLRHSMRGHRAPITALVLPDQAAGGTSLLSQASAHAGAASSTRTAAGLGEGLLWCVSGCEDGTIRRWDLVRGATTHILEGHDSPVSSLALAPVRRSTQQGASASSAAASNAAVSGGGAGGLGLGFWRLFSGGDANDGCIRCWDTYECFSSATEPKNTSYRYDQGGGRTLSTAQATAEGSSRAFGHKLDVHSGVLSMIWVAPGLVGEPSGGGGASGGGGGDGSFEETDYAGWLCCTLANQSIFALRGTDCTSRGKISLGSGLGGGSSSSKKNLPSTAPPASSLVGIFSRAVANSRSRARASIVDVSAVVALPVPLLPPQRRKQGGGGGGGGSRMASAAKKKAVMVVCAVGDTMRVFTTAE
jgi:hypothetical protein